MITFLLCDEILPVPPIYVSVVFRDVEQSQKTVSKAFLPSSVCWPPPAIHVGEVSRVTNIIIIPHHNSLLIFFFFYVELAKLFAAAAMSFQCQQRFLVWSLTLSYVICTILYPLNERNDLGQKSIISGPASFNVTSSPLNCRSFYGGFTNEQLRLIET